MSRGEREDRGERGREREREREREKERECDREVERKIGSELQQTTPTVYTHVHVLYIIIHPHMYSCTINIMI